jgi:putative flippase GtrA
MRFIPVGIVAVLTDLIVYGALLNLGLSPAIAKVASFICGALVAFVGNRYFTFQRRSGRRGFAAFWGVYFGSLLLNVAVNQAVLAAAYGLGLKINVGIVTAFLAATLVSALTNFVGMKSFVFRETPGA